MPTEIGYSVPENSLEFWKNRFSEYLVKVTGMGTRFGEAFISFEDPDGLPLSLIIPKKADTRKPWETAEVKADAATKGFHSITLTLTSVEGTARVLTDVFGYTFTGKEGNRYRYTTDAVETAAIVDIIEAPDEQRTGNAGGTVHHVAFRVKDEKVLAEFREKVIAAGLNITQKIDRNYFFSLYFREPGGVLFEIATDNPGFSVDESISELGKNLKLPAQYEGRRKQIEAVLPSLV